AAATKVRNAATDMRARLPQEISAVAGEPSAAVRSGLLTLRSAGASAVARFAWTWSGAGAGVTWLEGGAPQASPKPVAAAATAATPSPPTTRLVEVGLTPAVADVLGAHVGDHLTVKGPTRGLVHAVVSGPYRPVDSTDPLWTTVAGL